MEFLYSATLRKPEVLEMVRRLEAEIDRLQDKLNHFNATATAEIPEAVLDLAR
jgi:hypothetical protein